MSTAQKKTTEELIDECQGLVWSLARKIARALPEHVDVNDLAGYGQVGLAEAANAFDADRGVKFSTFAYYRIRGAIHDGISEMLWFRQRPQGKIKFDHLTNDFLQGESAEAPAGTSTLHQEVSWLQDVASSLAIAFFAGLGLGSDEAGLVDQSAASPLETLGGKEMHEALQSLVTALPSEERILIQSTYFEGLSLQQAADRMGISKSWASRLHGNTLKRLARSASRLGFAG